MINVPVVKPALISVSRDCFPLSLSVNRRKALTEAYNSKYGKNLGEIYEFSVCVMTEIHM